MASSQYAMATASPKSGERPRRFTRSSFVSIAIFGGAAYFIADNATSFAQQLITYAPKLNGLIARVAGMLGVDVPPTATQLVQQLNPSRFLGTVARDLQSFLSTAAFVLVYLGFIIASRRL